jgi:hypothetical protein
MKKHGAAEMCFRLQKIGYNKFLAGVGLLE